MAVNLYTDNAWKRPFAKPHATFRLTLRPVDEADRPWIEGVFKDRSIYMYLTDLTGPDEGRLWFEGVFGRRNYCFLMICRREDGRPLGLIVIHRFPNLCLHIGGFLGPDDRGRGYAAEALRGLRALAGDHELFADIDPDNVRARRLMDAVGARHTGRNALGRLDFQFRPGSRSSPSDGPSEGA
ncbi:GNAT family N-acetyltransferase [Desulfatiferula olefinivorans]